MKLNIVAENASELARNDSEAFAMLRRQGFGASDSSILLGVNPFPDGTIEKLVEQKRAKYVTAKELEIGKMVNVRKGSDLEPLIMRKFQEKYEVPDAKIEKPDAMYRIGDTPLTVNFDGVYDLGPFQVPVECKFISMYGMKYYDFTKCCSHTLPLGGDLKPLGTDVNKLYLLERAKEIGIPIYYYTQIQQQLLALDAPFGYLAALNDKDWDLKTFLIVADKQVQNKLMEVAEQVWQTI